MNMIGKNPDDDLDAYKDKHYFTYAILRNTLEELWAEGTIHSTPTVVQFTNTTLRSKMDFQFERIKLPTFFWNYENWKHFFGMFTASIDTNVSLTDC